LKKQTQFAGRQIGANYYLKGDYDSLMACGARKNKAKFKRDELYLLITQKIAAALRASQ